MVEADHKPLESLFKKTQSIWHRSAFSEHERMMLRTCIQQYKLMVKYRPAGDQLHIADTLSRASQMESTYITSLKFICSWVSQKKSLTSLKERQTLTQCYEKPVKEVILNLCNRFHKNHELAVYISKFHDLMNQKP